MNRYLMAGFGLLLLLLTGSVLAQSAPVTQPFTVTVTITPVVSGITIPTPSVNTPSATNANLLFSTVSLTTNPPGQPFTGTLTLGGAAAAQFALTAPSVGCTQTSSTVITCNGASTSNNIAYLETGPANVPGGPPNAPISYALTLTAGP